VPDRFAAQRADTTGMIRSPIRSIGVIRETFGTEHGRVGLRAVGDIPSRQQQCFGKPRRMLLKESTDALCEAALPRGGRPRQAVPRLISPNHVRCRNLWARLKPAL
jgi:hypothetical protein